MGLMKEVIKEIGNKSKEFYEFVLPPIDMHLTDENLKVIIDIPGSVSYTHLTLPTILLV